MAVHVGILGGTGPAGRGVAVRLAEAGVLVTIGSRHAERAATVAGEVGERWPAVAAMLEGAANEAAAAAEVVVVATPWDSAIPTVKALPRAPGRQGGHLHGQRPDQRGP